MRKWMLSFSLFAFLWLQAVLLFAQAADSTLLMVDKTKDFQVTGDGSAENWRQSAWLMLPQRNSGKQGYQTKMKILYSDSGIYCLYHCEDTKITATLKEDFADLYNEDVVEAFFWTDEQVPMYFEYELSPLNYELPILVPNIKGTFLGWRPWHYEGNRKTRHAASIERKDNKVLSWTAEFFIPFLLLKPMPNAFPHKGSRWRANFYRIDYDIDYDHHGADWSWQQTRTNFHDYEKFGTLLFR
ncbi:MAG TPA: carbohydrate-binding family 9-like protein [Puia sp.]|nr:carbohydrate-binding family 9-like protein [Puia sp.]